MPDPAIDSTAHDIDVDREIVPHAAGLAVAMGRPRSSEVIRPLPAEQVREAFAACQAAALAVLTPDDFEGNGDDRFLKKSGMRKVAAVTDLDVQIVACAAERDSDGKIVAASAIARATSSAGRSMEADGYCALDETRFKDERGRKRLEHDMRSTATTRAKTRAIAELLGIDVTALHPPGRNSPAQEASEGLRLGAQNAIGFLLDGDVDAVHGVTTNLNAQFDGPPPAAALQAVLIVASAIKAIREARASGARTSETDQPEGATP